MVLLLLLLVDGWLLGAGAAAVHNLRHCHINIRVYMHTMPIYKLCAAGTCLVEKKTNFLFADCC